MDSAKTHIGWFVLAPTLAMWLGCGIRGQFGNANGAMIPGALLALTISILLKDKAFSPGLAVGLTAVGFGFGADETTLQTAGFVTGLNPNHVINLSLGYSGLAIKGALWAMFGGLGLGMGLCAYLYRRREIVFGAILLVATFYAGWWAINKPKLLYFSYNRDEIWGGLLVGGISLLTWLSVRGRTRIPLIMAGSAAMAGAIGYPLAVTLTAVSMHFSFMHPYCWKLAETSFGAFMGAGIGTGTYLIKDHLHPCDKKPEVNPVPLRHTWALVLEGALGVVVANTLYSGIVVGGSSRAFHNLLPWTLLGPVLWCVAYYSQKAAWHIGVTMTFFATAADLLLFWRHDQRLGNTALLWILVMLVTLGVSWKVTGWCMRSDGAVAREAFLFLMGALVVCSYLIAFVNAAVVKPPAHALAAAGSRWMYLLHTWDGLVVVEAGYTVVALALTWMVCRVPEFQASIVEPQAREITECCKVS